VRQRGAPVPRAGKVRFLFGTLGGGVQKQLWEKIAFLINRRGGECCTSQLTYLFFQERAFSWGAPPKRKKREVLLKKFAQGRSDNRNPKREEAPVSDW